ncbi:putative periplasmic or secreted lipoprotein [Nostoc sp. PCC 7524]|uniref:BON domain-containing protein n=1 Tax=Nostoc sp. (strain ATCC 29411 / PCC 7524) TaxID=28072 RepID=UPI00029F0F0A|nr:BON domain-containing protein [Nostoc sp. PCC 7524]AFY48180.1 putative periplasmic or secreted lipoprotein [Nostoc sp. PCC 7524]
MKKLVTFVVSACLLVGTFGCQEAVKNTSETPIPTNGTAKTPEKQATQTTKPTDKTLKSTEKSTTTPDSKFKTDKQNNTATTSEQDLKNAVIKKLQKGLPGNKLEVENNKGEITLKGKAASKEELEKAEKLVKEVKGVNNVKVEAELEDQKKS